MSTTASLSELVEIGVLVGGYVFVVSAAAFWLDRCMTPKRGGRQ